jgi:iron(III) transport system permease protein
LEAVFLVLALLPVAFLGIKWLAVALSGDTDALSWAVPSERTLHLLGNSFLLAVTVTLMSTVLGTALAIWLCGEGWLRRLIGSIYLIPLLIPPYIHALEWMAVVGRRQFLDQNLDFIPGMENVAFTTYGFWPTAIVMTMATFPIITLLVRNGLGAIEPKLIESASMARGPWHVIGRIVLPLVMPSIIAGAGLVFVLSLVEYGVPSLLQYNVYVMEIYSSFAQYFDPVRGFAISVPLIAAAAVLLAFSQSRLRNSPLRSQPGYRPCLMTSAWSLPSPAWNDFTLTMIVAFVAGAVATIIAIPLALALTGQARAGKLGWFVCALPLAVPAPLIGIALIYIWNRPLLDWGYGTWLMLVVAHVARFLPFAVYAAGSRVRHIDPVLLEAAALPDVGWWRRFLWVRLPLIAPAVAITLLVVFVFSLGELGASLLISPPGEATLPMRIYNLLHYGATDTVAALSLAALTVAGIACAGVLLIQKGIFRRTV